MSEKLKPCPKCKGTDGDTRCSYCDGRYDDAMPNTARDGRLILWPENIVADRQEVSGKWVLHYLTDEQAEQCAAAMSQPATSEATPAAVISCKACNGNDGDMPCAYPSEGQEGCLRDQRLKPAAVSADVVEALDRMQQFVTKHGAELEECDLGTIRHAMDACRLDGARRMQEECASLANDYPEEAWDVSHGVHDTPRGYVVETSEQIKSAIRALSPETVCGGE